jgi:hypothetical protein
MCVFDGRLGICKTKKREGKGITARDDKIQAALKKVHE